MSVNITVNGKYTKSCLRHNLLNDPDRVRKETENERRKMRIQQVRAVSKNMAKKVRNDVEMEKERQLKKIEEIKKQEMEMWRQNVLAQQEKDFRSAIFQVGTAHRAAKAENIRQAQKKVHDKSRRFLNRPKNVTLSSNLGKENILKNANVQTDITGKCHPEPRAPVENRVDLNASSNALESSSSELEEECGEEISASLSTEISSDTLDVNTSSLSDSVELSKAEVPTQVRSITKLKKTVPVLMEVQQESDTSLINTPNIEDHHKQSNMHFSQMVSKKTPKKQKSKKDIHNHKSVTGELLTAPSTSATAKKRFTQISDMIRQQKSSDELGQQQVDSLQPTSFCRQKLPAKSKSPAAAKDVQKTPPKSKSKSPTATRPASTQTAGTLATKSSSSIPSQRSTTRVQFYDYNNKFQKQYEQPASAVEINVTDDAQMNATEQAELANRLREARELEMEKLRQKSDERCQKAIEKEQVRRACEDLTAKLDALTQQRQVLPSDNHHFSSLRLGQAAAEKETKLNNAVENILKRPAVITCPVVNRQLPEPTASSSDNIKPHAYDLNLGSAFTRNENNSLNSSDSCCSILLGYVDGQSKQIANDIRKYNTQNGETDRVKAEKLQNLLNRINRLRESLMNELKKCSTSSATDKERVQTMMDSISEFRKEHENILIDGSSKDSISKRENDLKKKEAILEKKLKEFYEIQKAAKKKDRVTSAEKDYEDEKKKKCLDDESVALSNRNENPDKTECGEKVSKDDVHRSKKKQVGNSEVESENKRSRSKMPNKLESREEKLEDERSRERGKDINYRNVQREANKRDKIETQKQREMFNAQESEERLFSSEEESEEEFLERRKLLVGEKPVEIVIKLRGDSKSKKGRKLPYKSPRKLSTLIQSPVAKKSRKKFPTVRSIESSSTSYRSLPPTIHNDVDKLLRNATKPVKEPTTQPQLQRKEEKNKLGKAKTNLNPLMAHYVQRLLGMSRTSINALGVSSSDIDTPSSSIINTTPNLSAAETEKLASNRLEHVQKFIEDNYSFIGELEESLRQSNSTDSSLKTVEVIWKKALKEHKSKKDPQIGSEKATKPILKKPMKKPRPHLSQEKQQTLLADKSTQSTDNCTQRIAELTKMINKVRQEKQKILETTLSSVSENGRNSTEYLDLPDRRNNSGESTSRILDSQLVKSAENLQTQSPETAPQLEKNKLTGMSRDSGISLSRPITVQESRDSPIEDLRQDPSSTESLSVQLKKPKPPTSITRYSPQLIEDIPHELSTIFEVDTPATSRVNTSIHANNGKDFGVPQLHDKEAQQVTYKQFPTFEEYARLNQLDMSQFDPEFSMKVEKEFNEFMGLAREGKVIDYEKFTSFSKYFAKSSSGDDKEAAEELLASLRLANLSFKKFPTRKEYLEKIGVSTSEFLDSQSLDNMEDNKSSNSSSTESLMNIEKELKLRKILTKSFRRNARPASSLKFGEKNIDQGEISGIRELTAGATSTDDQSENLENQLKRLGINWPSVMKKKTLETQALSSSTSSSLGAPPLNPRKKPSKMPQNVETSFQRETHAAYETTTQTDDGGRQLNLLEFFTKEFLKRTTTSSSFSLSDDSLANSILRSLIGSMTSSPHPQLNKAGTGLDRHKTSTPMASHSNSTERAASKSNGGTSSVQLFSGESRLSSVHFNNSSSSRDVNHTTGKDVDAESNKKF